MYLYEFDGDPLVVKIAAVVNQLKNEIETKKKPAQWSDKDFVSYLEANGIPISLSDLHSMIEKPPLKNFISAIEDHQIVFRGQKSPNTPDDAMKDAQNNKKTVAAMAKSALKKP